MTSVRETRLSSFDFFPSLRWQGDHNPHNFNYWRVPAEKVVSAPAQRDDVRTNASSAVGCVPYWLGNNRLHAAGWNRLEWWTQTLTNHERDTHSPIGMSFETSQSHICHFEILFAQGMLYLRAASCVKGGIWRNWRDVTPWLQTCISW